MASTISRYTCSHRLNARVGDGIFAGVPARFGRDEHFFRRQLINKCRRYWRSSCVSLDIFARASPKANREKAVAPRRIMALKPMRGPDVAWGVDGDADRVPARSAS